PDDAVKALLGTDGVAALTPAIRSWSLFSFNIPFLAPANINATFFIGGILLLLIFAIQHRGISETASVQKWLAIIVLVPLLSIGLYPIVSGQILATNVTGLVPPTAAYAAVDGTWSNGGWTLFL
ncbi:amino acid permease, partial [Rhizobium ruizarguesonis]